MAQLFPPWANRLPIITVLVAALLGIGAVGFVWYYFSPWYTDVGYRPVQPVLYSHLLHADSLGVDCRYCHSNVEISPVANVPPVQTCMNCHKIIKADSERLQPVVQSFVTKTPLKWVRVHKLPDFVYFDHSIHLRAGVGCASCHGKINKMLVVAQAKPLSMSWCLDCHRHPDDHLRPHDQLTNMDWEPSPEQAEFAAQQKRDLNIKPTVDCSGCHR